MKPSSQLSLDVQSPLAEIITHQPYSTCNKLGEYDKNIELVECIYGVHNWSIAKVTLAFTRQGYHWGCAVKIPSLGLDALIKCTYASKPVSTKIGAIRAGKAQIAKTLNLWGGVHPMVRSNPEYQAIVAWLFDNDEGELL